MKKHAISYAFIATRWVLIAVVLLIAVIGFLYLTRGTAVTTCAAWAPTARPCLRRSRSSR